MLKIGLFWFPPTQIGTFLDHILAQFLPKNSESDHFGGYYDVITGYHPTDPHNFYVRIIGEYGIFGIMFLIILFVQWHSNKPE